MIQKLTLKNFEAHKDTLIDFENGVTIIKGNSNAGKSSLFRALRFVLLNEPGGEDFINFTENETEVTLQYNNHIVTRAKARGNKRNEYIVDGKVLKAFGQGVPDEVKQVFGLSEINYEWQFDKRPFLLAETGGYIAGKLNEIVNLDLIDISLKNIEQKRRSVNKDIENVSKQLEDILPQIDSYSWIDKAEKELAIIENKEIELNKNKILLTDLFTVLENYNRLTDDYDSIYTISDRTINALVQDIDRYKVNNISYNNMVLLHDNYTKAIDMHKQIVVIPTEFVVESMQALETYKHTINILEGSTTLLNSILEQNKILDDIGDLVSDRRLQKLVEDTENFNESKRLLLTMKELYAGIKSFNNNIQDIEYELEELQKEWDAIKPETCPLCGNEFHKELT